MCGIVGFVNGSFSSDMRGVLHKMANAIEHRGPDGEGYYETNSVDGHHTIGLGHRRLAIIDLDSGHQPMGNEDGSIQIVFNGEIYNFKKLRKELIERGHQFRTKSDTETIVHAYEEYGDNCVEHLRGMFAFAIWDSRRNRLFLARDRFGKKPLFLYWSGGLLLFASEIKSILQFQGFKRSVNRSALWDYLAFRYVPGPHTLFEGIQKLPPGAIAVWEKSELSFWKYYTPKDGTPRKTFTGSGDDITGQFLKCLEDSVSTRMVSDVPFGAFLSGGLDSSAIVGLMSRHSDYPVKTFSVGFTESEYSELHYAEIIANLYRTEHHELTVSQKDILNQLPQLVRFRDAPIAEPSDIPIYLLSVEARKTVKMVLTGEGSDEFLGGYPKHVFERYVGHYQRIPQAIRERLFEPLVDVLPYKFRRAKTAIKTMGIVSWQERMVRWFGALSSAERDFLVSFRPDNVCSCIDMCDNIEENSALRKILYFDQSSWLPDNLLERGDRMTMAASLEARMPFLDHELAEFVSTLPDAMRVRRMTTKWILRDAMKRLLPREILDRPKVGFRVPVNEWFRGPMKEYLYEHLTGPASRTNCYYNSGTLEKFLSEHMNGYQNHEKLLWSLLNLEIWQREFNISA